MKHRLLLLLFLTFFMRARAQEEFSHGRIIASPSGHYLQHEDGTPFFWLGDTGWELFHRLKMEEINTYLDNREKKGFNVIQAVVLAEFDGLKKANQYGDRPLLNENPETPNEKYFKLIDSAIHLAKQKGLYVALLPTWGSNVTGKPGTPPIFNRTNAYYFGFWIGKRYHAFQNVLWVLGGDHAPVKDSSDWRPVWRAMAKGILDANDQKAFIAYHPAGYASSSTYLHQEPWLSMNMIQSGHGSGHDVATWDFISKDFNLSPAKPVLDAEPNYEDHPVNPWPKWNPANGYFRAYDVRKQLYRSVFAGACGVTYGHHSVWQFFSLREEKINFADRFWTDAINRPGAAQAGYLRKLISSRPYIHRVPDQSIITGGQGTGSEYSCAFADSAGSYLMVYMPVGKKIVINTSRIKSSKLNVWWFNPKKGTASRGGKLKRKEEMKFTPPRKGSENDWVLIVDDATADYKRP